MKVENGTLEAEKMANHSKPKDAKAKPYHINPYRTIPCPIAPYRTVPYGVALCTKDALKADIGQLEA